LEPFPDWATKWYELFPDPFLPTSEAAKTRVAQGLPKVISRLPRRGSRVLDLCCGAGAYLFAIEKAGYDMTGVDIQESMVREARRVAMKAKSKATILKGDARALRFADESFDAVVFLGAPLAHFSLEEFELVAKQAHRVLKPKGRMIADVSDLVALFSTGMYQRILYEQSGEKDVISVHAKYDGEQGTFERLFFDLETNKRFKGSFHIWAPWIADYVVKKTGFTLKSSEATGPGTSGRLMTYVRP